MFKIESNTKSDVFLNENILFENRKYTIEFIEPESEATKYFIYSTGLDEHLSWRPGNKFADLQVKNRIGKLRIFDIEYDVRSEKFLYGDSGDSQLEKIVNEIEGIHKELYFSFDSSVYTSAEKNWDSIESKELGKLNYLYHVFFNVKTEESVPGLLESIKRNPSFDYTYEKMWIEPWKVKIVNADLLLGLEKSVGGKVFVNGKSLTRDTNENRFIKYFFQYCQGIAFNCINNSKSKAVNIKANRLLNKTMKIMSDSFFDEIGTNNDFNMNSTILSKRHGYSDIFRYFMLSKLSIRPIFLDTKDNLGAGIINIAYLYEIWCFYKIVSYILGKNIRIKEQTIFNKNGELKHSTIFSDSDYEVGFNQRFGTKNGSSYSVPLRPDITVNSLKSGELYHFDAKYKLSMLRRDEDSESGFKSDDIAKMHTYFDAIYSTRAALILYPGDKFSFFEKGDRYKRALKAKDIADFKGVGAVPLLPGVEPLELKELLKCYFNCN